MKIHRLIKPLTIALFISLAFGQLGRLPGLPLGVNVYVYDLVVVLLLVCGFRWRSTPLTQAVLYFAAVAGFSWLLAWSRYPTFAWLTAGAYLARFLAYFGLYLTYTNPVVIKLKLPITNWLFRLSLVLAVIGLFQYLLLPDTRFLAFSDWDDHYYRLIGSVGDPSFLGLLLLLGLILRRHLALAIALLLTYSRSTYIGLLAVLGTYAWFRRSFKWLLVGILALIVTLPLLPRPGGEGVNLLRLFSIEQRLTNYQEGIALWRQAPVLGLGFNTLRLVRQDFTSHAAAGLDNSFLFVAATTGIVGLAAYLHLLWRLWQQGLIVKLSLVAIIIHAMFQNSLFYPLVMIWLWLLIAARSKFDKL